MAERPIHPIDAIHHRSCFVNGAHRSRADNSAAVINLAAEFRRKFTCTMSKMMDMRVIRGNNMATRQSTTRFHHTDRSGPQVRPCTLMLPPRRSLFFYWPTAPGGGAGTVILLFNDVALRQRPCQAAVSSVRTKASISSLWHIIVGKIFQSG